MIVFEILISIILWPLKFIWNAIPSEVAYGMLFVLFALLVLAIIFAAPSDKSDSTAKSPDKPTELSAGAYMLIGWGVFHLFSSSRRSKRETDSEEEAGLETETQRALSANKSKPKPQSQRSKRAEKRAEKLAKQSQYTQQNEQESKQEIEPTQAQEAQSELNLDALGSLLIKEINRPKDEQGERLTVKKGLEALGGVNAIDAYLSKNDTP